MQCDDRDAPLWHLAQGGDGEAYDQLYGEYARLVSRELQKRLHSSDREGDLEDLRQEVWLAVWKALPRFEGRSAFRTWVVGVTKNVLGSWQRHRHCEASALACLRTFKWEEADAVTPCDWSDRVAVQEALSVLGPSEQRVIFLRFFEQLSDSAIAVRLGWPLGTVKGRIRAALRHLKAFLSEQP
jgi:RNA polymerase sigma-70 factor (ECF subfamily)